MDTQAVVWLTEEPSKLSSAAQICIAEERREGTLGIADITLNEIAMLVARGRVRVSAPLETYLAFIESVFAVLPVTGKIAARAVRFGAAYPNDPADRLIGATAIVYDARLVTKDQKIRKSGEVSCVW